MRISVNASHEHFFFLSVNLFAQFELNLQSWEEIKWFSPLITVSTPANKNVLTSARISSSDKRSPLSRCSKENENQESTLWHPISQFQRTWKEIIKGTLNSGIALYRWSSHFEFRGRANFGKRSFKLKGLPHNGGWNWCGWVTKGWQSDKRLRYSHDYEVTVIKRVKI